MSDIEILTSHLGSALIISAIYIGWLLRDFSRRLGEVTRLPPYFRWFDLGNALLMAALLSYIFQCSAALSDQPQALLQPQFSLTAVYAPLLLGIIINLVITFIYWGWLIKEK
ncbi:MAG: hypothetical protein JXA33_27935 [Anaerolineae bacterium]|nr:hypothetical protein [Anaerolineae bacterium]